MTNTLAATTTKDSAPERIREDPLAHLPRTAVLEFAKGSLIYSVEQPSGCLYLVLEGKVKICRVASDGRPVVMDIYLPDEIFGEGAFKDSGRDGEMAVALESVRLMAWPVSEIEDLCARRPQLAIALLQLLVKRSMEFAGRIESFSVDNIARRLARGLIRFSDRLADVNTDGTVQLIPFTHELLSQYVGTSREIVTHYMNHFRRQGFLRYSRKGILVKREVMERWLSAEAAVSGRGGAAIQ